MVKSKKLKRFVMVLTCFFVCFIPISVPSVSCGAKSKTEGINVEYRTKKQIRNFVKKHGFNIYGEISYSDKPSVKSSSYKPGKLKKSSLKDGLNAVNTIRYVAGLSADVKLNSSYNEKCQAAALVNAANNRLSHYPTKPSGMSKSLYELGKEGASSSNLAMTSWSTCLSYGVVNQWMEDSDSSNIDRIGHRRWILNPSMKETGFGYVNNYSSMYVFNYSGEKGQYGVAWPAQNTPVEYFSNSTAWSISMGDNVDISKVKVTLTRKKDGKKWTFSNKKSDGYFNVNNDGYGQRGCIIFRPEDIEINPKDSYKVKITGLKQKVYYEVNFFKL